MLRAPNGEMAAWAEEGVGLSIANTGVDPVPGGGCVDEVEASRFSAPGLEWGHVDLNW